MALRPAVKTGLLLASTILVAGLSGIASAQNAEQTFRDNVLKKQRFLRHFYGESRVEAEWDQGGVKLPLPAFRTFGVLVVDSIKTKPEQIELNGVRYTVDYKPGSKLSLQIPRTKMTIRVTTHGAPLNDVFALLDQALFFPSADLAIESLPENFIQAANAIAHPGEHSLRRCDCGDLQANGCTATHADAGMKGMSNPKVLRQVDPEFSEEAREAKRSGLVETFLKVDTSGKTGEWWVTQSAGMGLDWEAIKALAKYQFTPATCHNQPVPVTLFIDTNFEFH